MPWRLIAVACVLALGLSVAVEVPREIARWYTAAAVQAHAGGDHPRALVCLRRALAWNPSSRVAVLQRAEIRRELGDFSGCLDDFETLLASRPDDLQAVFGKTLALQHLGRADEAVRVFEELLRGSGRASPQQRAVYGNALAYARAVAGTGLERALQESNQSLKWNGRESAEMLDTRGFILYQLGQNEAALRDLDLAASRIASRLAVAQAIRSYVDPLQRERQLAAIREAAAVIHYHRALVREAVGQNDQAERDLERVRHWGYEPDERLF